MSGPTPAWAWYRRAPLIVAALAILGLVITVFGRLHCNFELEWMTGSVFDHVERVRQGKPLYGPPTIEWTPFLYPPLYYEVVAWVTRVVPLPYGARLVSIAATFVQGVCVWRLARHHGASREWAFVGLGFFAGAFALTSFWYDIERVDSLFVAMMAVGVTLLVERPGYLSTVLAALIIGGGFFAKQPALTFVFGCTAGLGAMKAWRRAAVFFVVALGVVLLGYAYLQHTTDGWFAYYVLEMPNKHGIVPSLFKQLFFDDVLRAFALVAGGVFIVTRFRKNGVFAGALVAAAVASGSSRVHLGGWENVLMFFTTFGAAAAAVLATELESSRIARFVPAIASLQMLIWAYSPFGAIPSAKLEPASRAYEAKVRALEADGEVLSFTRGNVSSVRHAHHAAVVDVFRAEHGISDEYARPFRERKFAAVVLNKMDDLFLAFLPELRGKLFAIVAANYYVAEQLPGDMPDAPVGYHTHPRLVLKPRHEPLAESDVELLRCRVKAERTLAEARERAVRSGGTIAAADIEGAARDACASAIGSASYGGPVGDDPDWQ